MSAPWQRADPRVLADSTDAVLAKRSLRRFVRLAWPIVEPAPLVWGWHMDAICDHLEAVARGEILRLLITVPPRHAKSLLTSVLFPAWVWTWNPAWRSLFVSYSATLATEHSWLSRVLIESPWYQQFFSVPKGWTLAPDQNAKDNYRTTHNGHRFSVGMTGGPTGHGGDLVAVDDPLSVNDAYSEAKREEAKRIIGKVLPTRLNDQATGRMLMIMQRLHDDDPAAFVLAGGGWEHLCLPTEFESRHRSVTRRVVRRPVLRTVEGGTEPEPVSEEFWRDPRTEEGELLFPQRFPRSVIEQLKAANALGTEGFGAQHQQRPNLAGGNIFKVADWRFWKPDGAAPDDCGVRPEGCYKGPARALPEMDRIVISVDGTFKRTQLGSFVAIHVWGASGAGRFLLDRVHARMDYDQCERSLVGDRSLGREHPIGGVIGRWPEAREIVVEDKANGSMLVNRLGEVLGISGVVAEPASDGKEKRAQINSLPIHRAGNCYLPDGAPWLEEYIAEHGAFPLGKSDDDVDAQSQGLKHLEGEQSSAENYMRTKW